MYNIHSSRSRPATTSPLGPSPHSPALVPRSSHLTISPLQSNARTKAPEAQPCRGTRTRASSTQLPAANPSSNSKFLFTPADISPATSQNRPTSKLPAEKSRSSPDFHCPAPTKSAHPDCPRMMHALPPHPPPPISDDDADLSDTDTEMIYTSWNAQEPPSFKPGPSLSLRARIFGGVRGRDKAKTICTTPGQMCAGETETEIDEPVRIQLSCRSNIPVVTSHYRPLSPDTSQPPVFHPPPAL